MACQPKTFPLGNVCKLLQLRLSFVHLGTLCKLLEHLLSFEHILVDLLEGCRVLVHHPDLNKENMFYAQAHKPLQAAQKDD